MKSDRQTEIFQQLWESWSEEKRSKMLSLAQTSSLEEFQREAGYQAMAKKIYTKLREKTSQSSEESYPGPIVNFDP